MPHYPPNWYEKGKRLIKPHTPTKAKREQSGNGPTFFPSRFSDGDEQDGPRVKACIQSDDETVRYLSFTPDYMNSSPDLLADGTPLSKSDHEILNRIYKNDKSQPLQVTIVKNTVMISASDHNQVTFAPNVTANATAGSDSMAAMLVHKLQAEVDQSNKTNAELHTRLEALQKALSAASEQIDGIGRLVNIVRFHNMPIWRYIVGINLHQWYSMSADPSRRCYLHNTALVLYNLYKNRKSDNWLSSATPIWKSHKELLLLWNEGHDSREPILKSKEKAQEYTKNFKKTLFLLCGENKGEREDLLHALGVGQAPTDRKVHAICSSEQASQNIVITPADHSGEEVEKAGRETDMIFEPTAIETAEFNLAITSNLNSDYIAARHRAAHEVSLSTILDWYDVMATTEKGKPYLAENDVHFWRVVERYLFRLFSGGLSPHRFTFNSTERRLMMIVNPVAVPYAAYESPSNSGVLDPATGLLQPSISSFDSRFTKFSSSPSDIIGG